MQRSRCKSVFAIVLAGAAPAFAADEKPAPAAAKRVVVLGSSTALGVGASSPGVSWAGRLAASLLPRGYAVQNVSISGSSTADSLARFDRDVTPWAPEVVILATSLVNEPAAGAVQTFLRNTDLLIRRVESIGAMPVVVAPYPYNGFSATMYSSIHDIYSVLDGEGVPVLDFLDGVDDGRGHWLPWMTVDGTHPTDAGHQSLFETIPLSLFDALQRTGSPINPHGFGAWAQNTSDAEEGDFAIRPQTAMSSWTVSFWSKPSDSERERVLLAVNNSWLQIRRSGERSNCGMAVRT